MTRSNLIHSLKKILADTYALYIKTQNYHWNYEGPNFYSIHLLFEEQYKNLADSVDEIAELIRSLGEKVPASFEEFVKNSSIKSGDAKASNNEMLKDLLSGNELIQTTLNECLQSGQEAQDEVVVDYIIERLGYHRKAAWMLRSSL